MIVDMLFPGGKAKAFTLSYDDGVESDFRLADLMRKYGVKGTFNVNSGIKRMVEEDRDCSEILVQLMAVKSAINNTGKVILREHMEHCLIHAIEEGDMEAVEEFKKALEQFL